jgi:hypothetical protein
MAVVKQPVRDRGRHHGIEHGTPLTDRTVAGDQHAAAFVAARDELEKEMRGIGLERQVAEFVDDPWLRLAEVDQAILEPALAVRLANWATSVGAGTNSTE